ncbi:Hypothetical protein LUCI_1716 [Lucifera butyrica]|uniref:HTH cro/C1-type domain-containing protein n=1 Tax=Lucifera butyrica TaxID=1351585 RepID=A0A498R4W3_9FIRM|nr:helix-turn-helix transcriptional regulator [Lucifera butyrica]VBB06484.1 Hypothetical protein LUCI_1716 [Lucifera butyrica]
MSLKCHLSRIMGEKRINISEVAKEAGIARNTVTALYHETAKGVTWDVLEKLCAALDCQPGDLLEYLPKK